jgi:tRNA(fMet)-specific endonuclease VapC
MAEFMLDTNICIYVMTNRLPQVSGRFTAASGRMCISTITLAELHYGAERSTRKATNRRAIEEFVGGIAVLPFSEDAAAHFGQIRAALERAGTPASSPDILIAAHARNEGSILVTNNRREFDRIEGLRVENWV